MNGIVHDVFAANRQRVVHSVSARSVSRFVLEGLIMAKIQIAHKISKAPRRFFFTVLK
jgi:hypothetical protein